MPTEVSGIKRNEHDIDSRIRNLSIQTGEEFSPEFIRDRTPRRQVITAEESSRKYGHDRSRIIQATEDCPQKIHKEHRPPRNVLETIEDWPLETAADQHQQRRVGFHFVPNQQRGYQQHQHQHQHQQQPLTYGDRTYNDRSYGYVSGIPDGAKIKFVCSFGGKMLPRPSDGKLRYVGGDTRIISIRKNLNFHELMKKTSAICSQPHMIKYQLPGEDLDAIISVCSDEDLQHMIEEYHELEKGSQRLRIFLVSLNDPESPCSDDSRSTQSDKGYQYVVAINGMTETSIRKNSSRENLSASSQRGPKNSVQPIGGSSLNLAMKLTNLNQVIQTPVNMSYMQAPEL